MRERTRCRRDNLGFFTTFQGSESTPVHRAFSTLNLLDRKLRGAKKRGVRTRGAWLPSFGDFSKGKKVTQCLSH